MRPSTTINLLGALAVILFIVLIWVSPAKGAPADLDDPEMFLAPAGLELQSHQEVAVSDWSLLVGEYFDAGEHDLAMSIIECESGFKPNADNPRSTARGGWQFLKSTWGWSNEGSGYGLDPYPVGPDDPQQSTRLAAWLQNTYGWSQWECYGHVNRGKEWPVAVDLMSDGLTGR